MKISKKNHTNFFTKTFLQHRKSGLCQITDILRQHDCHALRCKTANTFYLKTPNRINYQVKPQTKNRYKKLCTVAKKHRTLHYDILHTSTLCMHCVAKRQTRFT